MEDNKHSPSWGGKAAAFGFVDFCSREQLTPGPRSQGAVLTSA